MITLGADIEVWTEKEGEYYLPYHVIGDSRLALPYGEVYPDGAALEFSVQPGSSAFVATAIMENVAAIQRLVGQNGFYLKWDSIAHFSREMLASVPLEKTKFGQPTDRSKRICALIFGCNPDSNIYDDYPKRPNAKNILYRSAGGHIHIGLPKEITKTPAFINIAEQIVLGMDIIVGRAASAYANNPLDIKRRKLYGLAGTYRLKPYGVEYRPLPSRAILECARLDQLLAISAKIAEYATSGNSISIDEDTLSLVKRQVNASEELDTRVKIDNNFTQFLELPENPTPNELKALFY